jgi:elongation factor Ts
MAEITAQLVKVLRDKTNAGMMDCQRALKETAGDLDAAVDLLRKKGIAGAVKRADKEAKEGTIHAVATADGKSAALIEVNCETDFVAKNEGFRAFVDSVAKQVLANEAANNGNLEAFLATAGLDGFASMDETIKAKVGQVGENIVLRRFRRFSAGANAGLNTYIHMAGKVGVLLELSAEKAESLKKEEFSTLAKDLALHICAANPEFLGRSEVSAEVRAKEEEIQRERMKDQLGKKPEAIQAKIVEGSMSKFFAQICLLEQGFVKDPDKTVEELVASVGKQLGDTLRVVRFVRFAVGEELKA